MRINIPRPKITLSALATVIIAGGFFTYAAYHHLIFDAAASAEIELTQAIQTTPPQEQQSPEFLGIKRADIAMQEYRKNVVEHPRGCNCGPDIDRYTEGVPAQWCTMFTSWVAKEAGTPLWNERTNSWRISNSRNFAVHLEQYGTWYDREQVIDKGLEPRVGDFIVYWRGNFEDNLGHVDIVVEKGDYPGTASLVGGNLDDRIKYRANFPYLQHYGFLGFGRPEKD